MLNDDPAYQLLARAAGFLEAAEIIVNAAGNKSVLRAPVAHLIAHAAEVLMKHVLLMQGYDLKDLKTKYGHSVSELWNAPEMTSFRSQALDRARDAWDVARASGKYDEDFSENSDDVLEKAIRELSRLHSSHSDFALRYVSNADEMVPNPLLLLHTLRPLKDDIAREYSQSERATRYA